MSDSHTESTGRRRRWEIAAVAIAVVGGGVWWSWAVKQARTAAQRTTDK